MATVNLTAALRLLRQFADNEPVISVIETTVAELDRLYEIEQAALRLAIDLKQNGESYDAKAVDTILRLAKAGE